KLHLPIRIEFLQIDIAVRQRVEMDGAEERLIRLNQQDRLRESVVVKTFAEMHPRLDREDLEGIEIEAECAQPERLHDLHEVGREDQPIVAAEFNDDPELAKTLNRVQDRTLDAYGIAGGLIDTAADLHVEGIARLDAVGFELRGRPGV